MAANLIDLYILTPKRNGNLLYNTLTQQGMVNKRHVKTNAPPGLKRFVFCSPELCRESCVVGFNQPGIDQACPLTLEVTAGADRKVRAWLAVNLFISAQYQKIHGEFLRNAFHEDTAANAVRSTEAFAAQLPHASTPPRHRAFKFWRLK
jgi:hypothetical protein